MNADRINERTYELEGDLEFLQSSVRDLHDTTNSSHKDLLYSVCQKVNKARLLMWEANQLMASFIVEEG